MIKSKSILTTGFILLSSLSFAQQWVIHYKGTITTKVGSNGSSVAWRKQDFDNATLGDVSDPSTPTAYLNGPFNFQITGTVVVRMKWTGLLPPTSYPTNYVVSSRATGTTGNGTATANNGFKSITGSYADVASQKLIQPGKVEVHETSISLSASTTSTYYTGAAVSVQAWYDGRYARVKADSIPEEYYVKGDDGTGYNTLEDVLWDGVSRYITDSYTLQTPKLENPVLAVGANRKEVRRVGLPEGVSSSDTTYEDGTTVLKSNVMSVSFTGETLSQQTAPERYTLDEVVFSGHKEETLPAPVWAPGWNIGSIGPYDYKGPNNHVHYGSGSSVTLTRADKLHSSDSIKLKYSWADGLEADAEMQLIFVDQFSNPQQVQGEVIHVNNPVWFEFPDGPYGLGSKEWETYPGGAKPVRYSAWAGIYKVTTDAVTVGGALAAIASSGATIPAYIALAGAAMSLGEPFGGPGSLAPADPYEGDTPKIKHVRAYESDPNLQAILANKPNDGERLNYLSSRLLWKAEYLPQKRVDVYRWDVYGPAGYLGQIVKLQEFPVPNPVDGDAKRFTYSVTCGPVTP